MKSFPPYHFTAFHFFSLFGTFQWLSLGFGTFLYFPRPFLLFIGTFQFQFTKYISVSLTIFVTLRTSLSNSYQISENNLLWSSWLDFEKSSTLMRSSEISMFLIDTVQQAMPFHCHNSVSLSSLHSRFDRLEMIQNLHKTHSDSTLTQKHTIFIEIMVNVYKWWIKKNRNKTKAIVLSYAVWFLLIRLPLVHLFRAFKTFGYFFLRVSETIVNL